MKNIQTLVTKSEIHSFVSRLWRSEEFIKSYRERGFVYDAVEKFAYLPRLFAEQTNDYLERAHFSTWWNVIMLRPEYDNPIIHDLYYLHEMTHAYNMPYTPHIGASAFREKMQRSELEASVLSEIAVYFEIPSLRDKSFDHYIYADSYLNDLKFVALWKINPSIAIETLRVERRNVMTDKIIHSPTEKWIRLFAEQNSAYAIVWATRYDEVEVAMSNLQVSSYQDRRSAIVEYQDWLEDEASRDPVDNIPFRVESELFSPFYWNNKLRYDRELSDQGIATAPPAE